MGGRHCLCVYTNPKQWEMFVQDITNRFPISSSGKIDRFLGMTFRQAKDRSWIEIDQTKYIDELVDKYNLTEADCTRLHQFNGATTHLPTSQHTRREIGQICSNIEGTRGLEVAVWLVSEMRYQLYLGASAT